VSSRARRVKLDVISCQSSVFSSDGPAAAPLEIQGRKTICSAGLQPGTRIRVGQPPGGRVPWASAHGHSLFRKGGEGNLLIPRCLMASLLRRTAGGLLNLKDLLGAPLASGRVTIRVLPAGRKGDEAYLLIPQWLMADLARRTEEDVLNLKDLVNVLAPSGKAALWGLVGRVKRRDSDLLILQELFDELG